MPSLNGFGGVIDARVPAEARDEFDRGRAAFAKKDRQEAVVHLQKATTLFPAFLDAHLLLATAFIDLREWAKAEAELHRSLEIKPDSPPALAYLGAGYWRQTPFGETG